MGVNSLKGPFQGAAGIVSDWLRGFVNDEAVRQGIRLDSVLSGQQDLSRRIARLGDRAHALQLRMDGVPFQSRMTIQEALARHAGASQVFRDRHLPGCHLCAVRFDETLGEAAEAYGIPLEEWLAELNALLP